MKDDYKKARNNYGKLKCDKCGNSNMRKMYYEVSIIAQSNLVSNKITEVTENVDNSFETIYCSICNNIIANDYDDLTDSEGNLKYK